LHTDTDWKFVVRHTDAGNQQKQADQGIFEFHNDSDECDEADYIARGTELLTPSPTI